MVGATTVATYGSQSTRAGQPWVGLGEEGGGVAVGTGGGEAGVGHHQGGEAEVEHHQGGGAGHHKEREVGHPQGGEVGATRRIVMRRSEGIAGETIEEAEVTPGVAETDQVLIVNYFFKFRL